MSERPSVIFLAPLTTGNVTLAAQLMGCDWSSARCACKHVGAVDLLTAPRFRGVCALGGVLCFHSLRTAASPLATVVTMPHKLLYKQLSRAGGFEVS